MTDPVLIVGAGPTGLTAALELSRMGVSLRLVDKRQAPATTSRAIGVQARTLELFEQRGLAEEMVRLGNKGRGLRKAAGDPNPSNRLSSRAASVRRAILASEIAVGILIGR